MTYIKPKTKIILNEWSFIIISNTLLMYLYYFIVWWGMAPYIDPNLFQGYVFSNYVFFEIGMQGLLFGLLFGLINFLLDKTRLGRQSFGKIILIKTILYFIAASFSQLAVSSIYHIFGIFSFETMQEMQSDIRAVSLISMTVYFILVILLINFILQINRKFGNGILLSMISGKYRRPKKEDRIFMFLDMKDSTGIAERLGHVKYSLLIQNCIHELTDLIIQYKAHVYQYVGDEVVLTWKTKAGLKDLNCIKLFFAYQQHLEDRKDYFQRNFGIRPEFKAGMSEGIITVAEVGEIKRELAYHGETLHTAARLEKLCNKVEQDLLITENLRSHITDKNNYSIAFIGEFQLRGKEGKDKVYSVGLPQNV